MTDKIKTPKKMGRPPSFTNAAELWEQCFHYFKMCEAERRPLTVVGLIAFLDISRDTFSAYGSGIYDTDLNDFSDTIEKARIFIERDKWEKGLTGEYKSVFAIFDLTNNHGAKNRIEHVTKDGAAIGNASTTIINNIDYTDPEKAGQAYNDLLKESE